MKIYTRTGDKGETGLGSGDRVSKASVRLHAYGTVDELNAILGVAIASGLDSRLEQAVDRIQRELFVLGADLALPITAEARRSVRVGEDLVAALERDIDEWQAELPPLKHFILPGGARGVAMLHLARTVCRRGERWVAELQTVEAINEYALQYLNRLSDWLFVAARVANVRAGIAETRWESGRDT